MKRYIIVRLFQTVAMLFIFSMIVFCLARLSGDPALLLLPESATKEDYHAIRGRLGFDKPIYIQYCIFVANALKGDFGKSVFTRRPVMDSIKQMLPNSVRLVMVATLMALILSIPLGVLAAVKKGTFMDGFARIFAGLGQSLPTFWVGLLLIQLFVIKLRLLPSSGIGDLRNYLMPSFCLSLFMIAGIIRLTRSSMLEVLDKEYIRLARIKGIPEKAVIWKHALRNSLLPVLSFSGMYIAILVTGSIVAETIFAWPGVGRLAYRAIVNQDYPLIQGVVLVAATIVMGVNLLTDILYAYLDPRIRYQG